MTDKELGLLTAVEIELGLATCSATRGEVELGTTGKNDKLDVLYTTCEVIVPLMVTNSTELPEGCPPAGKGDGEGLGMPAPKADGLGTGGLRIGELGAARKEALGRVALASSSTRSLAAC